MSEPVPTLGPGMHVGPVIAVSDLDDARAFYEGRLGLTGEQTPGGWALRPAAGASSTCSTASRAPGSATWPVASFRVDDAHATVRELRGRGVSFLGRDDLPFASTTTASRWVSPTSRSRGSATRTATSSPSSRCRGPARADPSGARLADRPRAQRWTPRRHRSRDTSARSRETSTRSSRG